MNTERAFEGLAGSPLSKVGRPRQHASNASKQKLYRERKRREQEIAAALAEHNDRLGEFLPDAPHGKGRLVSGGYSSEKIEQVQAAHERDEQFGGKRAKAKGYGIGIETGAAYTKRGKGPTLQSIATEAEDQFEFGRKIRFPTNWKLDDREKEEIVRKIVQEQVESAITSTGKEWNPEGQSYEFIPGTHKCLSCESTFDWRGQAESHFKSAHKRVIERIIRENQPKQTDKPEFRNADKYGWKEQCKYN